MTTRTVYLALYRAGVTYWETPGGKLGYRAPNGLSSDLKAFMREYKTELLFLCAGGMTVYGKGQEPAEWMDAE